MPTNEQLGRLLRKHRIAAGLTQCELARRTNLTNVYVCYVEKGKANVALPTLSVLLEECGVELVVSVTTRKL